MSVQGKDATRRDFVQIAAQVAALPSAAEFFAGWLRAGQSHSHSSAPPEANFLHDYKPRFFDAGDFAALESFTEILIPTDETPGAREAHCAHYIDFVLASADEVPAMQKEWRAAFAKLKELGFHAADASGRAALVEKMSSPSDKAYSVFRLIKRQNAFAFYTSRAGLIENLDYRGDSYNEVFPACTHPEHQEV
jgi:Gluconate 2-dehydrogenase subunit 3